MTNVDDSDFFSDLSGADDLDELFNDEVAADPAFAEGVADIAHRNRVLRSLISQRKSLNITQTDVAKAMGTTQSAVSDVESGGNDLHLSTLQRYARAVGAELDLAICVRGGAQRLVPPPVRVYALSWNLSSPQRTPEHLGQAVMARSA